MIISKSWLALRKTWRYVVIYGAGKTLFKVFGRLRPKWFSPGKSRVQDIALIGCGQFAYATIGYSIWRKYGNRFAACYDIDRTNHASFALFYGLSSDASSATDVIKDERIKFIYIASNHASHTPYAIEALGAGKTVFIEKPISVSIDQFRCLASAVRNASAPIYAGYNRPFSGAILNLRTKTGSLREPMTLNCFVSGHVIGPDHWYRKPQEGTRICGNVGHWLDLAVHMLSWGELPDRWHILIAYSNASSRDDDLSITMTSERGDLINVVLTARNEPFEGINETINFQQGGVIAKIDDFRRMTIWKGPNIHKYRYWPKDVGHNACLIQPFSNIKRDWKEVEMSTLLMLHIADMVISTKSSSDFSFSSEFSKVLN